MAGQALKLLQEGQGQIGKLGFVQRPARAQLQHQAAGVIVLPGGLIEELGLAHRLLGGGGGTEVVKAKVQPRVLGPVGVALQIRVHVGKAQAGADIGHADARLAHPVPVDFPLVLAHVDALNEGTGGRLKAVGQGDGAQTYGGGQQ